MPNAIENGRDGRTRAEDLALIETTAPADAQPQSVRFGMGNAPVGAAPVCGVLPRTQRG